MIPRSTQRPRPMGIRSFSVRLFFFVAAIGMAVAGCATSGGVSEESVATRRSSLATDSPRIASLVAQPGDSLRSIALRYLGDPSFDWLLGEMNGIEAVKPGQFLIVPLDPVSLGGFTPLGHQTVPILTYHKFTKGRGDTTTVTERTFEEQMKFLSAKGYRVITLDAFFDFLDLKRQIPLKSVVITVDDGWRSFYEIAYPILKKYGYPATLFVYTDFILANGKSQLDWDALREMNQNGVDIQTHTKTHRYLDRRIGSETYKEYFDSIRKELVESAAIIRKNLHVNVRYVAYPFGETNHLVCALLDKLEYRGGLTVERAGASALSNRFRVNRSMIFGTFDIQDFESSLKVFDRQATKLQ
jgi:peptidoglycan/xylan/chitin deacetylase (PgdA/CDA1 family)